MARIWTFGANVNTDQIVPGRYAPYMLKRVKEGDAWTCRVDEISDWMYLKNGRLVGGESIRVLRNKMSASERAKFDASAPFKID